MLITLMTSGIRHYASLFSSRVVRTMIDSASCEVTNEWRKMGEIINRDLLFGDPPSRPLP